MRRTGNFFYRFNKIQTAILFSFSVLIIIALIIFTLISLTYTRLTIFENSISYTTQIISQVNDDIDSYIDYMENTSILLLNDNDLQTYLFSENSLGLLFSSDDTGYMTNEEQRMVSQIKTIKEIRPDIVNVVAIADNGKSIVNDQMEELNPYVNIEELQWYIDTMESQEGINVSSSHLQNLLRSNYQWVITLSRQIINEETKESEGIFFVDLNYESISDLCNKSKIGEDGYIFIIDREGNIIYHPQQQLLYGGLKEEYIEEILESENSYFEVDDWNGSYLYTMTTSEKTGWTVVGVADTAELLQNNGITQISYIIVAIALILGALIISGYIAKNITKPLEQMRKSMSMVEQGKFSEANIEVVGTKELVELSESFNGMTYRIDELMKQNVLEQKEKRKSELKALQAQINPHFLYNTLDSIIWMSAAGKNEEVADMTSALSKLFRQSISNEREELTIEEEIEYVKSYLIIQKMRYKDKMEYDIDIEKKIYQVPIIKFALQPLVENAIYHGLKYKEGKGMLLIKGYQIGEKVSIEIIDNGDGMTEHQLMYIFDEKQTDYKKNGVGVVNVQKRLQLHYGSEYGIEYKSEKGKGTTATITVPYHGKQDEDFEK